MTRKQRALYGPFKTGSSGRYRASWKGRDPKKKTGSKYTSVGKTTDCVPVVYYHLVRALESRERPGPDHLPQLESLGPLSFPSVPALLSNSKTRETTGDESRERDELASDERSIALQVIVL